MRDRDIVDAIVAGDPAGLAAAYDSYAAGLYGYCRSLLGEPADAADAVQDTFIIAAAKVGGLRSPGRLRPWLYAVARNECHGRLRARARQAGLDEAADMSDDSGDVTDAARRAELRDLVLDAVGGLNEGDREVIELNLRHDLAGADLAGVLGVPVNQAHALASRARAQLERALGALLVARTGRRDCIELDDLLEGWDGRLTALLRKRIGRHIDDCDICSDRKRRVLSPAALLSLLPLVPLPPGLRDHVFRLVSEDTAEAVGYRGRVVSRAGAFDPAGFPVQVASPAAARRPWRRGGGDGGGSRGGGGLAGLSLDWLGGQGERSAAVILAGAAVLVLLLCGGGLTAYVELSSGSSNSGGQTHTGGHHKTAAGPVVSVQPAATGFPVPSSSAPVPPLTSQPVIPPPGMTSAPVSQSPAPNPSPVKSVKPKPAPDPAPDPTPSSGPTSFNPVPSPPPTSTPTSTPTTGAPQGGQSGTVSIRLDVSLIIALPF